MITSLFYRWVNYRKGYNNPCPFNFAPGSFVQQHYILSEHQLDTLIKDTIKACAQNAAYKKSPAHGSSEVYHYILDMAKGWPK